MQENTPTLANGNPIAQTRTPALKVILNVFTNNPSCDLSE